MQRSILLAVAALLLAGVFYFFALRDSEETPGQEQASTVSQTSDTAQQATAVTRLSAAQLFAVVEKRIQNLDPEQRRAVLSDATLFSRLATEELQRQAILAAASDSGLNDNPRLAYALQRQTEDGLITQFIRNRLNVAGIPQDMPSEAQVQQFYQANLEKFKIGRRMPVWQIFWAVPENATEIQKAKVIKQASRVSSELKSGKKSFAELAEEMTEHQPSRRQGGFMGVLQIDTLRPELKEALLGLKPNKVSSPISSSTGVHILRRGKIIAASTLPLDEVRPRIVQQLRKNYQDLQIQKLRQLASKKYADGILDKEGMERWRVRLGAQENSNPAQK